MVSCKRCEAEVEDEQSRPVGNARFCVDCFEKLMSGEAPAPAAETEAKPKPRVSIGVNMAVQATPACSTCGKKLAEGTFKTIGGLRICNDCYGGMQQERWQAREEDEEEAAPEDDAPVVHPGLRKLRCEGCSKRVPEGGSKKIYGKAYCPDCFSALKEATESIASFDSSNLESSITRRLAAIDAALLDAGMAVVEEPKRRPAAPSPAARAADPRAEACAACQLPAPPERMETVAGFVLCSACRSTDQELALDVARKRHLLWLKRQRAALEEA